MLNILFGIPLWVWPLFVFLLLNGLRARKQNSIYLAILIVITINISIFVSYSIYYFIENIFRISAIYLFMQGTAHGFMQLNKQNVSFNYQKKIVEFPGSRAPLVLSMSIFSAKFLKGLINEGYPELKNYFLVEVLDLFALFVLGIFVGRGINCIYRYYSKINPVATKLQ